jgi:cytochrome P450
VRNEESVMIGNVAAMIPPEVDLFRPAILSDPFAFYPTALSGSPVVKVKGRNIYVVFRHELVAEVMDRVQDFSNNFAQFMQGRQPEDPDIVAVSAKGWPFVDTLLTADPPIHSHFRRLVNVAFSGPRVNRLESSIRSIASKLLEGFGPNERCDFIQDFAMPFPVAVISEMVGLGNVPPAKVKRWSDALADRIGGLIDKDRELECAHEVVEFQHAVMELIRARSARPEDDFISDLVRAHVPGQGSLSDIEALSILQQVIPAGNETSTVALSRGLLLLMRNPDAARLAREDPSRIRNMVEEMLRIEGPAQGIWRITKAETRLAGFLIPAGSMILVRLGSANRDPAVYASPDLFDIDRAGARTHLAFGRGIHSCLGMMLARKELSIAYEEVLRRMDDIQVAEGAEVAFSPSMVTPALRSLPITFRWLAG